jgi:hypothetical protein
MPSDAKDGAARIPADAPVPAHPEDAADRLARPAKCFAEKEPPDSNAANAMIALRYLEQAANSSGDIRMQANTKAVAGYLYERYLGDSAAAVACNREALKRVPGDTTLIEAVERLEKKT